MNNRGKGSGPIRRLTRRRLSSPYSLSELWGVVRRNLTGPVRGGEGRLSFMPQTNCFSAGKVEFQAVFTGDWMPAGGGEIRFDESLLRFFHPLDALIINFEGVSLSGGRRVVMQQVHGPESLEVLERLSAAKKIFVSCANNHAADHGRDFFRAHWRHLESRGFQVVGSREKPWISLTPGIRLAALTAWSNHPGPFLAGMDLEAGLAGKGDFSILYPHWGFELELFPRPCLVKGAAEWISRWDMVMGHHAHTPAPLVSMEGAGGGRPVAFSLGNFVTRSRQQKNRWGMVVKAGLGRDEHGRFRLRRLEWRFSHVVRRRGEIRLELQQACPYFPGAEEA